MSEEKKFSDREFLDAIYERLKNSGHAVVIVDVGIWRVGKFIAIVFGVFAFFALLGFGIDVKQVRDDAHATRDEMLEAAKQFVNDITEKRTETNALSAETVKLLTEVSAKVRKFDETANEHLETSMTTFADYIHANAENIAYSTLREFYSDNVEFARDAELITVEVNMLLRLAQLQWKNDDKDQATVDFSRSIVRAKSKGLHELAGDVQMKFAELHIADFHEFRSPSAIKARRLYQNALESFLTAESDLGAARAYDGIAQSNGHLEQYALQRAALQESRRLYRKLSLDSREEYSVVTQLAEIAAEEGNQELQRSLITESISIAENLRRYELAEDRYLKLALLAKERGANGEVKTQLCFAWRAHSRQANPSYTSDERLKSKTKAIQPSFSETNCP